RLSRYGTHRPRDEWLRCPTPSPPVLRGRGQGEGDGTPGADSPSPPTPLPRSTGGEGSETSRCPCAEFSPFRRCLLGPLAAKIANPGTGRKEGLPWPTSA